MSDKPSSCQFLYKLNARILLQLNTEYRLQKLPLSLTAQLSYRLLTEPIELNKKSKEGKVSIFENKFLNIGAGVRNHLQ